MTVYTFYYGDGGRQIYRRWLSTDKDACEHAAALCDELGCPIEVAKGEELEELATYEPDDYDPEDYR